MDIQRVQSIQSGEDKSIVARFLRIVLLVVSWVYSFVIGIRNWMFTSGVRKSRRIDKKVISIGNITTGGTGKTPFTIELAKRLIDKSACPAVILRGYKSKNGISDEAVLIKDSLGEAGFAICNSNRQTAAQIALKEKPQTDIFILDDGFQHRQVYRDLDIVLIDATCPFGFNHVLPRGMLRESVNELKRADAVIVTRADKVDNEAIANIDERIKAITKKPVLAHTAFHWGAMLDESGQLFSQEKLSKMNVAAICGIGNPNAFFTTLKNKAQTVVSQFAMPDHYYPNKNELISLLQKTAQQGATGADAIVTTEKDWVKWRNILGKDFKFSVPILRPQLTVHFLDGEDALNELL